jgi:malto-oligosyltrehalose trehalohydrolase
VEVVIKREAEERQGATPYVVKLMPEGGGYFSDLVASAGADTLYYYRLDKREEFYPDPTSRFQPRGRYGSSQVIDPGRFPWTDSGWSGVRLEGQVIYEMHLGACTRAGTWEAASHELQALADAGITLLEGIPVADFAGAFGWGYDGVDLFAPSHLYGTPADCRRFVDRAHAVGLGVILDVVYNHVGPDGDYLEQLAPVFCAQRPGGLDGAVLARDLHLDPAPEPLLAPPENRRWEILWSSEDPRYGGGGSRPLETEDNWQIPGEAAVVLRPTASEDQ